MRVILIGRNRAVIAKVPLRNWEKYHWYLLGSQLYKLYPDGIQRFKITRYGRPVRDDEGAVFKENAVVPYHGGGQSYEMDKVLSEIAEHKLMVSHKVAIGDIAGKLRRSYKALAGSVPMIAIVAFVAYVVIL